MLFTNKPPRYIFVLPLLILAISLTFGTAAINAQKSPEKLPYQNAELPTSQRIDDLLDRMTIKEKIGQMTLLNNTLINKDGTQGNIELDPEKARKYVKEHDIGFFHNGEAVPPERWYNFVNELQKIAVKETRLGIPLIYGMDHMHGASYLQGSTVFPHNINLAATFNTDHTRQAARITSRETAPLGHHWLLAPVLDLGQNPYWPRFYETFGESPLVAARHGSTYVSTLQNTRTGPFQQAATAKHFLGYSVPETGWDRSPAHIPDQALHEYHRPSFQAAVDAGVKAIMLNSSEINGVPVHASKEIVSGLLREKMGFEGVIATDWNDIGKLENYHKVAEDYTEATYKSIRAGIDISDTPLDLRFNRSMMELYKSGRVSEARIDSSVRRILRMKFELGLFENPYPSREYFELTGSSEHKRQALEAARSSLVLLKNQANLLPLKPQDTQKLLVIGPAANSRSRLNGGWTLAWQGGEEERYPQSMETVYTALKNSYSDANIELMGDIGQPGSQRYQQFREAAAHSDAIVIAAGEKAYAENQGNIDNLKLPAGQLELIKAANATGAPTLLVMIGGRPRVIYSVVDSTDAIIFAGLPGFEGGSAIADVISGEYNPSGKLPFTYPGSPGHHVTYYHKLSAGSLPAGQTELPFQWPFGHGLSYTEFKYSELSLSDTTISIDDSIQAEVTISNTGNRKGTETVLWYTRDEVATITRPVKELNHFEQVTLKPGQSKRVSFTITPEQHLSYPDFEGNTVLQQGYFKIMIDSLKKRFRLTESNIPESGIVLD